MYNQNVNNLKKKNKMEIFKKKKKCTKGMEIYTNIKNGICFQCKKIGYKKVLKEVFIVILHIDSFKDWAKCVQLDHYREFWNTLALVSNPLQYTSHKIENVNFHTKNQIDK